MSSNPDFYIFRDGRRRLAAAELLLPLRGAIAASCLAIKPDDWLTLLLRAGELECALCDAGASLANCARSAQLTDLFAEAAVRIDLDALKLDWHRFAADALTLVDKISYSGPVSVGVQEGFAYYAIHPLDYADRVAKLAISRQSAFVVGIRSIGTTLSAVVGAGLREIGVAVERTTARPVGHPYDRQCTFSEEQLAKIRAASECRAEFIVCDEGPGRSSSSLLSVAEALERAGVPCTDILILCSHEPDVRNLCAPDAVRRWSRFRSIPTGMTTRLPVDAVQHVVNTEERQGVPAAGEDAPALWPQFERLTYLSCDGRTVLTFEGHGQYGQAVRERNQKLSDAGFGLPYVGHDAGFSRHRIVEGITGRRDNLSPALLTFMAEYCACRAREFAVAGADPSELDLMARVNFEREFGFAPQFSKLHVVRATICDNQMMPRAWLKAASEAWLKLDAATRGDDHVFPGPCDIAWDLAGITVEWELSEEDRRFLLAKYRESSGDDAGSRLAAYESAYAIFRMAWSRMAAASVSGARESARLMRDYERYRSWLQKSGNIESRSEQPQAQTQSA